MTSIIENKCIKKGVRLTDQRKLIAQVMSKSYQDFYQTLVV